MDQDTLQVMLREMVRETVTEGLQTRFGPKAQMNYLEADRTVHLWQGPQRRAVTIPASWKPLLAEWSWLSLGIGKGGTTPAFSCFHEYTNLFTLKVRATPVARVKQGHFCGAAAGLEGRDQGVKVRVRPVTKVGARPVT